MHQIKLSEKLFKEAQRRAKAAGYRNVEEFVADQLEFDFSAQQENFDDRFTPEALAARDQMPGQMAAEKSVPMQEVDERLTGVRDGRRKPL